MKSILKGTYRGYYGRRALLEKHEHAFNSQGIVTAGRIPKMSVLFISHNGAPSRHKDYTCNERFARYVAEDVVFWAQRQLKSISNKGNVVCGVSLSGLASAHIALNFPLVFSSSLCQSGSFWWHRKHFAGLPGNYDLSKSRFC